MPSPLSPPFYLKQVYFTSTDPLWHQNYLTTRNERITSLLQSVLGNDFWENYAKIRLQFEREGLLLLRIKSITNQAVCFTQIWTSEKVAEEFRRDGLRGTDMMALLKARGIDHREVIRSIDEDGVKNLISSLKADPHIVQVMHESWRSPGMAIGDPLKQGKQYLPFPE